MSPSTKALYVIRAADGQTVTFDLRTGPSLTANRDFSYVWEDAKEAEAQKPIYEKALGVTLRVEVFPPPGVIARH